MMLDLKSDDNLYVESISRLERNVDYLRKTMEQLKAKGINIFFFERRYKKSFPL